MTEPFTERVKAAMREARAQARLRAWTFSYDLELCRRAAADEQRNLACAGYCLLLAMLDALGRGR